MASMTPSTRASKRGESCVARADTSVGSGVDNDENGRPPNASSPRRAAAIQNQEDILVSDLAFSDMFVENCGVSGPFPIHFLEPYLLFYKTKQLQTGDREASASCFAIERYI